MIDRLREAERINTLALCAMGWLAEAGITKGTESRFKIQVRGYVTILWRGAMTLGEFTSGLAATLQRGFYAAWLEGAARYGVTSDELSDRELIKLNAEISTATAAIESFGISIIDNRRASGGKLAPLLKRGEMWTRRYDEVRQTAEVYAGKDQKLMWTLGPTKEKCPSCLRLHGKVKRASYWAEKGILPRIPGAPYLVCRGYRCGCSLLPTDAPLSKGRLPHLP